MKSIILLLAGLALLGVAGVRNVDLLAMRRAYKLTQADPLDNAPPLVAFTTVAFGGFRGVVADLLWLRSARLQEEGKYFELVQLADWITKLEPRFASVWEYHAWNLAYNISVLFSDPRDRWRWVSNGMHLLRDEGLVYNPGNARLLYELGWIFQHKIGTDIDQAHLYYKRAWVAEMGGLFNGPRPDYAACRAAPDAPNVVRMRDEYKLDPALMERIDGLYGPLDWRLAQAHAIYWAWQSRQVAEGFDVGAADRMIFQSLADAFRHGRLFVSADGKRLIPSPNIDLIPRVDDAFQAALKDRPDDSSFKAAHANFLREAVTILFAYNREAEARKLYEDMASRYPSEENGKNFAEFLYRKSGLEARDLSDRDALAIIEGMLYQSAYWQTLGDADRAAGNASWAVKVWTDYMAQRENTELKERTGLPPIEDIRKIAMEKVKADLGM